MPNKKQSSWLDRPEMPDAAEMLEEEALNLSANRMDKPWSSSKKYLQTHYELIREDSIAPLRDAIAQFKTTPDMVDDKAIAIYEKVRTSR